MRLARVVGNVVSTIKDHTHSGLKLMIVEPIDLNGNPSGFQLVCIDTADAGTGDIVIISDDGDAALMIFNIDDCAVDSVICGVLDNYTIGDQMYKV